MKSDIAKQLFCELAGINTLSDRHVQSGLDRLIERIGEARTRELLLEFETHGLASVRKNEFLCGLAKATTYWLYTGVFPGESVKGVVGGTQPKPMIASPEDYFESVVWKVIQAHPPGLSGGYYGHWHYPPEDSDDGTD
jgi:hypothetical protein